jgi:hypothetical protein
MGFKPKTFLRERELPPTVPPKLFPMSTPKRKRAIGLYDDSESDSGFAPTPAKRVPAPIPAYAPVKVGGQNKGQLCYLRALELFTRTHHIQLQRSLGEASEARSLQKSSLRQDLTFPQMDGGRCATRRAKVSWPETLGKGV